MALNKSDELLNANKNLEKFTADVKYINAKLEAFYNKTSEVTTDNYSINRFRELRNKKPKNWESKPKRTLGQFKSVFTRSISTWKQKCN